MAEVTARTFYVEGADGSRVAIPRGTPRTDDVDDALRAMTHDGEIADHMYVEADEPSAPPRAAAATFGEVDTEQGTVTQATGAGTGLAQPAADAMVQPPARNASRADWAAFMTSAGQPVDDAESRDDLVDRAEEEGLL